MLTTLTVLLAAARDWAHPPRCPLCGDRTRHLYAHLHYDHAGDHL